MVHFAQNCVGNVRHLVVLAHPNTSLESVVLVRVTILKVDFRSTDLQNLLFWRSTLHSIPIHFSVKLPIFDRLTKTRASIFWIYFEIRIRTFSNPRLLNPVPNRNPNYTSKIYVKSTFLRRLSVAVQFDEKNSVFPHTCIVL